LFVEILSKYKDFFSYVCMFTKIVFIANTDFLTNFF